MTPSRAQRLVRARWFLLQRNPHALWALYVTVLFATALYLRLHAKGMV